MSERTVSEAEALEVLEEGSRKISDSDIELVIEKEQEINRKFRGPLAKFILDGRTLFSMVKDYWHKNYREIPWWTVSAAAAALLYVLNPMDLVPDFIPFVGLLDDATVLSVCLFMIDRDLAKYRNWKGQKPSGYAPEEIHPEER